MEEFNYLDIYLDFQKKFKPIKYFANQKEIVKISMEILADIITDSKRNRTDFIRDIKLIYPNYFTDDGGGRFTPIMDELILFNGNDMNLKKRVLQHMSYYLTGKSTKFIRISKSLLENENLKVSSFFVQRNGYKAEKGYKVFINGNFDTSKIEYPAVDNKGKIIFPIDVIDNKIKGNFEPIHYIKKIGFKIDCQNGKLRGNYVPSNNPITNNNETLFNFSANGLQEASDGKIADDAIINNVVDFCEVFREPLSAHYIMLADTSLLYVYSQTAKIEKNSSSLGYGGMFILLKRGLGIDKIRDYIRFFQLISDSISICIAHNIMREKQLKESIKSAISAIMSRNMSHNLGSHYMYYTKAYLERLANTADDIAPDIRGAAKVLGYVQARMDYLATVISNDKYPYGAVNFKSQIFDELTIDDFSHRHFILEKDKPKRITNFLLKNLILSENFTRPEVTDDTELTNKSNQLFLHVKLLEGDKKYSHFTGTWHTKKIKWVLEKKIKPTMATEEDVKNLLSSLNIALPGGSMSCHALFNVIENFIRNSAKYLQNDNKKDEGLICTIAIAPNSLNSKYVDITIYDNKKNANKVVDSEKGITLYNQILEKLKTLEVIDNQNKISKENKGFKEMLFSSIWMRAYTFGKDKSYADIVFDINQAPSEISKAIDESGENNFNKIDKLAMIEKHGFSLVKVKENSPNDISIYKHDEEYNEECCLGIQLTLPLFKQCEKIVLTGDKAKDVSTILNTMADIVEVDKNFMESDYHHVFTRPLIIDDNNELTAYEKYHKVIVDRFPDIDEYSLSLGNAEESYESAPTNKKIYFERHLSTSGNADPMECKDFAYADTISGGNFTITLLDLFCKGYENGEYRTDDDKIFSLKIKESALTRITIIDERLFNSTSERDYPWLTLKNIRILNFDDSIDEMHNDDTIMNMATIANVFVGNNFKDNQNKTHFLTIHLGLIEKILKNSTFVNKLINKKLGISDVSEKIDPLAPNRVKTFMGLLREQYSGGNSRMLYVAVHSGRGNYSVELEGPLSKYPFISLSALENAYNNSKFQLAQLLYNTVYIGKGYANNIYDI